MNKVGADTMPRARRAVRLNIRILPGDASENKVPLALIEGDKATLVFLGNLILDDARNPQDCGIQMFPRGPGNIYFGRKSEIGLYLHRLPCWNKKVKENDAAPNGDLPPGER